MTHPDPRLTLARQLLTDTVDELERLATQDAFHTLLLPQIGAAAVFLGATDLQGRVDRLLETAPRESFFTGGLATLLGPEELPAVWRTLPNRAVLEQRYPPYNEEVIRTFVNAMAQTEPAVAHCLAGRLEEAKAAAREQPDRGHAYQCLAVVEAFLGHFSSARDLIEKAVHPPFRQQTAQLVLTIEQFRRGQSAEGRIALRRLADFEPDIWDRAKLTLGLVGREPWSGYPFPE